VLVIALLALIVLGPQRLPDAARQVGQFMGEIRKLSSGFQREIRTAFDEETEKAARAKGAAAVSSPSQVDDAAASTPTIGALTPTDAPMPPADQPPPSSPAARRRRAPLTAADAAPATKTSGARKAAPAKKAAKRASP